MWSRYDLRWEGTTAGNCEMSNGGECDERKDIAPAACVFAGEFEMEYDHVGEGNRAGHLLISVEGGPPGRIDSNLEDFQVGVPLQPAEECIVDESTCRIDNELSDCWEVEDRVYEGSIYAEAPQSGKVGRPKRLASGHKVESFSSVPGFMFATQFELL